MQSRNFAAKLGLLAGLLNSAYAQTQLTLTAPVPAVPTPGGAVIGTRGSATIYYWVVARYPIGTVQSATTPVPNTVDIPNLNGTNFVTISWPGLSNATGYDVVRSNAPLFPSSCSSCAVATNTTSTSVNDTGGGSAYSLPAPAATPASGIFNLNNLLEPAPYLQLNLNGLQYRIMPFSGPYTIGDVPMFAANGILVDSGSSGGGGGGGVPTGRKINTTAPLTGGGTLAADLTLGCSAASGAAAGCLSAADWTTFNSKQASGSYITGLTGDGTASGPGSVAFTLANVNAGPGVCIPDNLHTCQITTNAKGLVTNAVSLNIFSGNEVLNNQANTYTGGGLQNMSAVDLLLPVHAADPGTCTAGQVEFNSTGTVLKVCTSANTWTTSATGSVAFSVNGAPVGTQPGLNFISGNGINQVCVNNGGASRVDCTPNINTSVVLQIPTSQAGKDTFCNSTTGTTSYTCTLVASALLTAYTKGMFLTLVADASCPAACTVNVDGVGVVNLKQLNGSTDPTGQITAGQPVIVYYDGTVFRIVTAPTAASIAFNNITSGNNTTATMGLGTGAGINIVAASTAFVNLSNGGASSFTLPSVATPANTSAGTFAYDTSLGMVTLGNGTSTVYPSLGGNGLNNQTGASYTISTNDRNVLVTHSNAGAIAVTLPVPSASFPNGWCYVTENRGTGTVTITSGGGSTIDGAATFVVTTNQGAILCSNGSNWFTGARTGMTVSGVNTAQSGMTLDLSAMTGADAFKVESKAGFTSGANGSFGFDTTGKNYHGFCNGADCIIPGFASAPVSGDLITATVSGGNILLSDANITPGVSTLGVKVIGNAGVTGTTINTLTDLTGAGTAVIASHTSTSGAEGITVAGAGTAGSATVASTGIVNCVFDGSTTQDDWVQRSTTTDGNCHDSGSTTYPVSGGQVVGRVIATNGGGPGTYGMFLDIGAGYDNSNFAAVNKTNTFTGTNDFTNAILRVTATAGSPNAVLGECKINTSTTFWTCYDGTAARQYLTAAGQQVVGGKLSYGTATNCSSSASPAVCGSSVAGSVVVAAAATTVVVNTTAVTANSEILIMYDSSLGTKLSVTCNTTEPALYGVTARSSGTSFTITSTSPVTNPACFSFLLFN